LSAQKLIIRQLSFQNRGPYNFTIKAGKCLGLQGQSGAGKTLLLRAIADLDPHQGTISLGAMNCLETPPPVWRKKVSFLPAENQWWHNSVGEHFNSEAWQLEEYFQQLGFNLDVLKWEISRLSTGEKQRLAILRLLQNQPEALLLDEPTANLDVTAISRTESLLLNYQTQKQIPLLWVSHDPEQLLRVADLQMYLHRDGKLTPII